MRANATPSQRRPLARGDASALDRYLVEIGRIPLLSAAAEAALGERVRAGDRSAVDALVRHNLRFVVLIARRYARHGVAIQDLIDEGNIGLIHAAERFDERYGYRFISYAVFWIRQAIFRYLDQKSRLVRVPVSSRRQFARLGRASEGMSHALGREPTTDELTRWTGMTPNRIERLRLLPMWPLYIDGPGQGQDAQFDMNTLEDPRAGAFADEVENDIKSRRLAGYLDKLDPRGADIIRRYYGLHGGDPETLQVIGQIYGVTRERARQLRDRTMDALRTLLEREQDGIDRSERRGQCGAVRQRPDRRRGSVAVPAARRI